MNIYIFKNVSKNTSLSAARVCSQHSKEGEPPRGNLGSLSGLKFSIIIPVREINDYIKEAIPHYMAQKYQNFEILIFPNHARSEAESHIKLEKSNKIKIIPTGNIGPAEKRDLAIKHATGEILAFIDDDAYPDPNWLSNALKHFKDPNNAGVGGPGITPPHNSFLQQVSGDIFCSKLCSGKHINRYIPKGKVSNIDDWPSCNLLVRKDIFEKVGGFNSNFWPGEDTKLCHDIVHKENKKLIYDPDVIVWHHRRNFGFGHFKQLWNYALHRGYFVKKFPKTSLRIEYFIPTLFILGIITGILLWDVLVIRKIYIITLGIYTAFLLTEFFQKRNPLRSFITIIGIFLSHIAYGGGFMVGLFKTR